MKKITAFFKRASKVQLLMLLMGVMVAFRGTQVGIAALKSETVSLAEKLTLWVPLGVLFWVGAEKLLESFWRKINDISCYWPYRCGALDMPSKRWRIPVPRARSGR